MGKRTWTEKEEVLLEECYKKQLSMSEMIELLNKTHSQISDKAVRMGLTKKYIKPNSSKFKAIYQNYDWCFERYINRSMSYQEIADECGASLRVIQKWCCEKHKLNQWTFKEYKKLNKIQYQLILFGTLGDGHIDKREDQPMYIESHSLDEKDYIFWKYNILKDLCNKEPIYHKELYSSFGKDRQYLCKPFYRINTRIINELSDIRGMSRLDKIKQINEFGLSLHTLDDGSRSNLWEICLAEWSQEEIEEYINTCKIKFNLECIQNESDKRYVHFTAISSKKLDEIILNNIPNNLDIISKKILNNNKIKQVQNYRYVITNNEKIGLGRYCKLNHLNYENSKNIFDTFNLEYVDEKDFLLRINEHEKIQ